MRGRENGSVEERNYELTEEFNDFSRTRQMMLLLPSSVDQREFPRGLGQGCFRQRMGGRAFALHAGLIGAFVGCRSPQFEADPHIKDDNEDHRQNEEGNRRSDEQCRVHRVRTLEDAESRIIKADSFHWKRERDSNDRLIEDSWKEMKL